MTTDTLFPAAEAPPTTLSHKAFREVYVKASKLLEPLAPEDQKRVIKALAVLFGEP